MCIGPPLRQPQSLRPTLLCSAPSLLLRLCVIVLLLGAAHAGCPGAAAPGYFCAGSVKTQCPVGFFCMGESAGAMPCMTQANCAAVGLSAEPPCVWNVTTLAGSGSITPFANGQGTAATFRNPIGVAADASGVVYVADSDNHRIRAVTSSGLVSTLAGSGGATWADGTGATASFKGPNGIATYSGSGIIYIADTYNYRIRKLTLSGATTTFAGSGDASWADGQGASASFYFPIGLTVDSAGVVYVADQSNHRIRKITPLGAVATLAGTGSTTPFSDGVGTSTATFNQPFGVAVDGSGNVFVGDTRNHRIRLILSNGTVSTFAGSGSTTWADGLGTSAAFKNPNHLSIAANGNLLVADSSNHRVRMITPLGVVRTIAGGSTGSFLDGYGTASLFNVPIGITVSSASTLYIGDQYNHRIRALSCVACPASFYCTTGVPILCPAGFYCLQGSLTPCPSGTSSSTTGAISITVCQACLAGTFSTATGATSCQACTSGTYSSATGAVSSGTCQACAAGFFSSSAGATSVATCQPCPVNTNSSLGSGVCCPLGFWSAARTTVCNPCAVGTYSTTQGASSSASCVPCPAGTYCGTIGMTAPLPCPVGRFSSSGAGTCCLQGTWSSPGTTSCTPCTANTYSTTQGATSSSSCLACSTVGPNLYSPSSAAVCCALGYWASPSSLFCNACPAGTYSSTAAASSISACTPCVAGTWGGSVGLSSPTQCQQCPPGNFCPTNTSLPKKCPANTFNSAFSSTSASSCMSCSNGSFSFSGSSTCQSSGSSSCSGGTFIDTSSGSPSCTPCPAGTFSAVATASCNTCPSGTFSSSGAIACDTCQKGSWCSGGFATECPSGTFNPLRGSTSAADCVLCDPGTYNPSPGASSTASCFLCPAGSYSGAGASFCTSCAPGAASAVARASSNATCLPCEVGSFGTLPGQSSCGSYCPKGTFGIKQGGVSVFDACQKCPIGTFTPSTGSIECTECSPGFFADQPGSSRCTPCPQGSYLNAPGGSVLGNCSACPMGTYGSAAGQTSSGCISCPAGTASPSLGAALPTTCVPCFEGTFAAQAGSSSCAQALAGTFSGPSASSPTQCPLGTFSSGGAGACTACPLGSAASTTGSTACVNCSAGFFADAPGLSSCTPCPIGTFNNLPSSTSPSACQSCPSGTFNPSQGQTSSGCISCPPGTASSTPGASSLSQCTPCSAGTYASLAGSSSCIISPAGSFNTPPPSGGATGATYPTLCPLGTYSGISGAVSVTQCTACPSGKTTASTGATQDTQCLALPFACPAGKQPNSASASSLADCAPLSCPLPLRPSAFAGFGSDAVALAQSLSCLGCASGSMGTVPTCTPCDGTAFCPGFTSRPLYNFSGGASSASGAPRALAQGSGMPTSPFSACPALASLIKSTATTNLPSAATSTVFFGVPLPATSSQSLLAWFVIFSSLFIFAMFVTCSRTAENATGCCALPLRSLKTVDLFSMSHRVENKASPINEATPLGGLFSLMGLTTLLTYAAYMVTTWLQDNTLVQKSLATMGPSVWGELAALPWVASSASSLLGSLALRLTIDGNPGACVAPLSITTTSLDSGSFVIKSTADCDGSGISQHTLTCPGCRFTSDTAISLVFDYSCQSMLLEALGSSPSYPGPLALSTIAAPTARTAPPKAGALLTSLTWELTPVLSVLWDNITAANSAIGWYLADSKLTLAPFFTPPGLNGSLSIIPTASSVTVTFALSLSSTYSSTLLTQRVPITQLLANIVGLSGLLTFFGMAFGSFEGYCARKKGGVGAHKHLPLSSKIGSIGDGGGSAPGGSPMEASSLLAVDNPLRVGSPALFQRETGLAEDSLRGELQALRKVVEVGAQREAALWRKVDALEAAAWPLEAPRAAVAAVVWQRLSDDSGDVWYTSSAGETAWELPTGAILQPAVNA